jgi:hypothetical protein
MTQTVRQGVGTLWASSIVVKVQRKHLNVAVKLHAGKYGSLYQMTYGG